MNDLQAPMLNTEHGLLQLSGTPETWIWAFTCRAPECACRSAIVLCAPSGDREVLLTSGQPVAEAWLGGGGHAQVAEGMSELTAFALDLDTRELHPPIGDAPLDLEAHPVVKTITERLDDEVLDAIARVWHLGKGEEVPAERGEGAATIEIEAWRPGDLVIWDEARPTLRSDVFVFGERVFAALELYCVAPTCECSEVIVDFSAVSPRGAPDPGHIELDGAEATLHPVHERHRERLTELWGAYVRRYPHYRERFAHRSTIMHGLAARIVAAPPKPKVGRNGACPCGSGKKYKKCCGGS